MLPFQFTHTAPLACRQAVHLFTPISNSMNSFHIWKKNIARKWYTEYENSGQSTCLECFAHITNENYTFNKTRQVDDSNSSVQTKFHIFHLEMAFSREKRCLFFICEVRRPCTLQQCAKFEIDSNQIFLVKKSSSLFDLK